MPELPIRLYGQRPSFDPKAGPLTGLVEVEGGTSAYLVDRERERCRVASFPGTERDRWTGPVGVLLAARRGWWGLSIRLDGVARPTPARPSAPDPAGDLKVPHLPRDLASCPRCGLAVVIRRDRRGAGFRLAVPTRRLAARATEVFRKAGLFGFAAECRGRGRKAGLDHEYACYGLDWFRPFHPPAAPTPAAPPPPGPKNKGGHPRRLEPKKSPFPMAEAKAANARYQSALAEAKAGRS